MLDNTLEECLLILLFPLSAGSSFELVIPVISCSSSFRIASSDSSLLSRDNLAATLRVTIFEDASPPKIQPIDGKRCLPFARR